MTEQAKIVAALDSFFHVSSFKERDSWQSDMSDAEFQAFQRFAVPTFVDGPWNGLMLDNSDQIDRVYLIVFPSRDVLDKVIAQEVARAAPGAMIFAHHPADFEENGRGFVQVPEEQLEELREHHISFYSCHAPLDCHPEVSTGNALANALGLRDQQRFASYYDGQAGVSGVVGADPISLQAFAERLAKAAELPRLRYDQVRNNGQPVHHVGVVPGGGGDDAFVAEAAALGCDTFVTGHWWPFNDTEYSRNRRVELRSALTGVTMNLLGASHYASELVVMRDQMPAWFRNHGVETELVRQQDPWR